MKKTITAKELIEKLSYYDDGFEIHVEGLLVEKLIEAAEIHKGGIESNEASRRCAEEVRANIAAEEAAKRDERYDKLEEELKGAFPDKFPNDSTQPPGRPAEDDSECPTDEPAPNSLPWDDNQIANLEVLGHRLMTSLPSRVDGIHSVQVRQHIKARTLMDETDRLIYNVDLDVNSAALDAMTIKADVSYMQNSKVSKNIYTGDILHISGKEFLSAGDLVSSSIRSHAMKMNHHTTSAMLAAYRIALRNADTKWDHDIYINFYRNTMPMEIKLHRDRRDYRPQVHYVKNLATEEVYIQMAEDLDPELDALYDEPDNGGNNKRRKNAVIATDAQKNALHAEIIDVVRQLFGQKPEENSTNI